MEHVRSRAPSLGEALFAGNSEWCWSAKAQPATEWFTLVHDGCRFLAYEIPGSVFRERARRVWTTLPKGDRHAAGGEERAEIMGDGAQPLTRFAQTEQQHHPVLCLKVNALRPFPSLQWLGIVHVKIVKTNFALFAS